MVEEKHEEHNNQLMLKSCYQAWVSSEVHNISIRPLGSTADRIVVAIEHLFNHDLGLAAATTRATTQQLLQRPTQLYTVYAWEIFKRK